MSSQNHTADCGASKDKDAEKNTVSLPRRGRPKEHKSGRDRQVAYRERQKANKQKCFGTPEKPRSSKQKPSAAERKQTSRSERTPEKKAIDDRVSAQSKSKIRSERTPEKKAIDDRLSALSMSRIRSERTPEKKAVDDRLSAQSMSRIRSERTPEKKATDNRLSAQSMSRIRSERTPEKKAINNASSAKIMSRNRARRTPQQKAADNAHIAEEMARRRELEYLETANNRANFGLNEVLPDTNFHQFESHPETSVLLHHLNSGHEKFRDVERLIDLDKNEALSIEENPICQSLKEEIEAEMLNSQEKEDLLSQYLKAHGRHVSWEPNAKPTNNVLSGLPVSIDAPHLACGMCGIKTVHGRHNKFCHVIALEDLPPTVSLTKDQLAEYNVSRNKPALILPVNDSGDMKPFYVHKLQSVYFSRTLNNYFHLHPEFVHLINDNESNVQKEATVLCPACHKWHLAAKRNNKDHNLQSEEDDEIPVTCKAGRATKKKSALSPPDFSIAAGVDFGNPARLELESTSMAEDKILAKHRHFHSVVKVQNNHEAGKRSD